MIIINFYLQTTLPKLNNEGKWRYNKQFTLNCHFRPGSLYCFGIFLSCDQSLLTPLNMKSQSLTGRKEQGIGCFVRQLARNNPPRDF